MEVEEEATREVECILIFLFKLLSNLSGGGGDSGGGGMFQLQVKLLSSSVDTISLHFLILKTQLN